MCVTRYYQFVRDQVCMKWLEHFSIYWNNILQSRQRTLKKLIRFKQCLFEPRTKHLKCRINFNVKTIRKLYQCILIYFYTQRIYRYTDMCSLHSYLRVLPWWTMCWRPFIHYNIKENIRLPYSIFIAIQNKVKWLIQVVFYEKAGCLLVSPAVRT